MLSFKFQQASLRFFSGWGRVRDRGRERESEREREEEEKEGWWWGGIAFKLFIRPRLRTSTHHHFCYISLIKECYVQRWWNKFHLLKEGAIKPCVMGARGHFSGPSLKPIYTYINQPINVVKYMSFKTSCIKYYKNRNMNYYSLCIISIWKI